MEIRATRPLVLLIQSILTEASPLTVDEIYNAVHRRKEVDQNKYTRASIQNDLNDHSKSVNWEKWGKGKWPILFERVPETRPLKWCLMKPPAEGPSISRPTPEDEANSELDRQKRQGEIAVRPGQDKFKKTIRQNYGRTCAVTDCNTPQALEAAHIRAYDGKDDNSPDNGILLRVDIHALFDAFLITLSEDGSRLDICEELADDPTYAFLRDVNVKAPRDAPPSKDNIRSHRERFLKRKHA